MTTYEADTIENLPIKSLWEGISPKRIYAYSELISL
jgi:hypothetical protein